jgi:hypothetical protein
MNSRPMSQQTGSIAELQERMLNVVYLFTSAVAMPVESALRIGYGSMYYTPAEQFFGGLLMVILPLVFGITSTLVHLIPGVGGGPAFGFIGMWGLSKLFFLGSMVHGFRVFRRMIDMSKEQCSVWEGEPWFFFNWIPKSSFWKIKIFFEPLAVLILAAFLQNIFVLDSTAAHYLMFAALCLMVKSYCQWLGHWMYLRQLLDMKFAGPIIARMTEGNETEEDRAQLHVASLPKDLDPDIRRDLYNNIGRAYSVRLPDDPSNDRERKNP